MKKWLTMYNGVSVQFMNMLDYFSFGNLFRKVNVEVFDSQISASFSLGSHIAFWILSVPHYHHCKPWNLKMKMMMMMMRISRVIGRGDISREKMKEWLGNLPCRISQRGDGPRRRFQIGLFVPRLCRRLRWPFDRRRLRCVCMYDRLTSLTNCIWC